MLAVLAAAAVAVTACGGSTPVGHQGNRLEVVATTTQIGDIVREIGGNRVSVHVLTKPGEDPRTHQPTANQQQLVANADLILRSGAGIDPWLDPLLKRAGVDRAPIDLSKAVVLREAGGVVDPHWWLDPHNVEAAIAKVRDALIKHDGAGSSPYIINARRYLQRVRRLDHRLVLCFTALRPAAAPLALVPPALSYFAGRYRMKSGESGARAKPPLSIDSLGKPGSKTDTLIGVLSTDATSVSKAVSGGTKRCR